MRVHSPRVGRTLKKRARESLGTGSKHSKRHGSDSSLQRTPAEKFVSPSQLDLFKSTFSPDQVIRAFLTWADKSRNVGPILQEFDSDGRSHESLKPDDSRRHIELFICELRD